jgi:hypothetical protein
MLRLFALVFFGVIGGIAAGIVFVFTCAATVGDGSQPGASDSATQLADFFWVPPLAGVVLGVIGAILLSRRHRNGGGSRPPCPPV